MYVFNCDLDAPFTAQQARRYFLQSQRAENLGIGDMVINGSLVKIKACDLRDCEKLQPKNAWCKELCERKKQRLTFGLNENVHLEIASEKISIIAAIVSWLSEFTFLWWVGWRGGSIAYFGAHYSFGDVLQLVGKSSDTFEYVKAYLKQTDLNYHIVAEW